MTKRKSAPAPKFKGDLVTPIKLAPPSSTIVSDLLPDVAKRAKSEAMAHYSREVFRKLALLAKHYGLDGSNLEAVTWPLLISVCSDLIPGFKIEYEKPSRRGRPKLWDARRNALFVDDVEMTMAAKKCNQREALWHLIKTNEKYKPKSGIPRADDSKKAAMDALEARLAEAKHGPLAGMIAQLHAHDAQDILLDALKATKNPPV